MDNPETITFDVGGKLFKVSRNMIEQFPDTMLGKIVSETWQRDPSEVVFIDRDGDIFAHILNYLRYGSIVLPNLISRKMFDREMDYYGITTNTVKQESSIHALELVKNKLEDAELEHDMFLIAVHAYHKYMTGERTCYFNEDSNIGLCRNPFDHASNSRLNAKQILKDNLKSYYGIDAWSITFSQPKRSLFDDHSSGTVGVNLHLGNPADERPSASPFKSGLLQEGEWYCSCTTKNPVDADTCLACEAAKPVPLLFRNTGLNRLPSHSFGAWNAGTI